MQRGCSIGLSRIAGNRGDARTALTQGCGRECLISPSPINAPVPRGDGNKPKWANFGLSVRSPTPIMKFEHRLWINRLLAIRSQNGVPVAVTD
jgi:hypothetical protein